MTGTVQTLSYPTFNTIYTVTMRSWSESVNSKVFKAFLR